MGDRRHHASRAHVVTCIGYALALLTSSVAVRENGWLTRLDGPVTGWFVDHRTHVFDRIATTVTVAGGPTETAALGVVVAIALWLRTRRFAASVVVVCTVGAAAITCAVLKLVVGRGRPPVPLRLMVETDHSFPSGHVTGTATLLFMTVIALTTQTSRSCRALLNVAAAFVVILVGASRLYLGVHWLTDVLAGVLLAALIVTIGAAGLRRVDADRSRSHSDDVLRT